MEILHCFYAGRCAIPADLAAAVIDITELLDLETFRAAYLHIAQAKRLKKAAILPPHPLRIESQ
jgi:hypothetical protein